MTTHIELSGKLFQNTDFRNELVFTFDLLCVQFIYDDKTNIEFHGKMKTKCGIFEHLHINNYAHTEKVI